MITDADRRAASMAETLTKAANIMLGNCDDLPTVQAFALHREATEAAIVAWLRDEGSGAAADFAGKIAAGAHRG